MIQSKYILWCLVSIKLRKFHIVLSIILINTEISYYESIIVMIYNVKELRIWCLAPHLTLFQLHRGAQIYWWRKLEYPEKLPTCRMSLTNLITKCCIEYTSPWAGIERTRLVVICTDCFMLQVVVNPATIWSRPPRPLPGFIYIWLRINAFWVMNIWFGNNHLTFKMQQKFWLKLEKEPIFQLNNIIWFCFM
jgi:hypothetical protein